MKPFLKWVGGKSKLLPELLARVPSTFANYHEPFLGGGALFFALAERLEGRMCCLSDANGHLIECYEAVRDDVDRVIHALRRHERAHRKSREDYYYRCRTRWNRDATRDLLSPRKWRPSQRAAMFLYMNKTCWNGVWRVNGSGSFNVPAGRYKNPTICNAQLLRAASQALEGAVLFSGSFERVLGAAGMGDFVYFDPPYDPVSDTAKFTGYTPGGFRTEDQERLAEVVRELYLRGCHVLLSNSDTPLVRKLYRRYSIDVVHAPRALNSKTTRRGVVPEVIVTAVRR